MNFLCKAQAYLNSVTSTVNSLTGIVISNELQGNIETQYKITVEFLELEQGTSEFILGIGLDSEIPQSVAKRRKNQGGAGSQLQSQNEIHDTSISSIGRPAS